MVKKRLSVPAGEFKARCLDLLAQVTQSWAEFVVTKRGRPVARVSPVEPPPDLKGSIVRQGDLVSATAETWAAEK